MKRQREMLRQPNLAISTLLLKHTLSNLLLNSKDISSHSLRINFLHTGHPACRPGDEAAVGDDAQGAGQALRQAQPSHGRQCASLLVCFFPAVEQHRLGALEKVPLNNPG